MSTNRELRLKINDHFTIEELRVICFDLHIDYEHIPDQGKMGKIIGLIDYASRTGRLNKLLGILQEERPHVMWIDSSTNQEPELEDVDTLDNEDDPVRNAIWNALYQSLWTKKTFLNKHKNQDPLIDKFSDKLWAGYFNKPIDAKPEDPQLILQEIRNYFFSCTDKEFYKYLNFILDYWNYLRHYKPDLINKAVNRALAQQNTGLQYVPQYEFGEWGLFEKGSFEQVPRDTDS